MHRNPLGTDDIAPIWRGKRSAVRAWPGLKVEYAWLPPFEGHEPSTPNRLKAIFSAHDGVAMALGHRVYDITAAAGSLYTVGDEPPVLLRVPAYSDTLNILPDVSLLRDVAEMHGIGDFTIESTFRGRGPVRLPQDPGVLAASHLLRRACLDQLTLSDIEASGLGFHFGWRLLSMQYGVDPAAPLRPGTGLGEPVLRRVCDYIEAGLRGPITLGALAALAGMSPFHFARCFRTATGLPPHQYVLARRIDLAKRLLLSTDLSVQEIAWTVGFENVSHFRRQFAAHLGGAPGELRRAVKGRASPVRA